MNGKLLPAIAAIVVGGILLMIVRQVVMNTRDIHDLRHRVEQVEKR